MLIKHKEECERKQEKTTIRTSDESHIYWKILFHKNPLNSRISAEYETDNEIECSKAVGNRTTNFFKQNPVFNGSYIVPELDDFLKSCY